MVRRNLMIAVLDKQKRLLDDLVMLLLEASPDESGDGLFCIRKVEQVSDNLKRWVRIQRHYGSDETMGRRDRTQDQSYALADSFPAA